MSSKSESLSTLTVEKSSLRNCPFFNKSLPSVSTLSDIAFPEINHMPFFIDDLDIQDVVVGIAVSGGLTNRNFQKKHLDKVVKICQDNWIFQWRHLKVVPLDRLRQLGLPLYLENEMSKAIEFHQKQVITYGEMSKEEFEKHAKYHSLLNARNINENERNLVLSSWMALLNKNVEDETMRYRLTETFYSRFFDASPVGKRLFESRSQEEQAKTLFKIIGYIVNNLENMGQLNRYIKRLGGRHALYGVTENDFIPFIEEWSGSLLEILGSKVMNDDTIEAWNGIMRYCARTMIEASKSYEEGTCLVAMVGDSESDLKETFLRMTLDRMYFCYDDTYSKFKKQLTLRGLTSIRVTEVKNYHCFELTSTNPPFNLVMGADNEREMKKLIKHFAWRIKALQRVHVDDEGSEDASGDSSSVNLDRLNQKIEQNNDESSSELSRVLTNVEILQRSWKMIVGNHGKIENNDIASKFFDALFDRLISLSPSAEQLFGKGNIIHHIPALTKMISLIIRDRGDIAKDQLMRVGAKHCIWGIKQHDIQCFATSICDAFQKCLGDIVSQNVRDAWFYSILGLGKEMLKLGKKVDSEFAFSCPAVKKSRFGWTSSTLLLTLSDLHIYKGNSLKKLKTSINFSTIEDVEKEESGLFETATEYCLYVAHGDTTTWLCFSDRQTATRFKTEILWRLQATEKSISI
eukprot:TRINITY_DN3893_c0_g1_i1.p1 TRINITY_DN3893_c0_g1~~TRINITY_DN3893_c0_g1_i1.p1  ORF type:complete len:689 (-),score=147.45 TRINITY_DN3893_c0_g1_i1:30-2096(-)